MKKLLYIFMMAPFFTFAQDNKVPTFQEEYAASMAYSQGQIAQLLEAIPQDKFTWRPEEGVRSISETFLHIVTSVYNLSSALGKPLPEGIDLSTLETSTTDKNEILKLINNSFAFSTAAVAEVKDDQMTEMVELPFGTFTKRSLIMIVATHGYEHKGQLIGYARVNGVTPPWSKAN